MVVVKKKDGRPRRTVDFQQLNKQCLREPNHGTSPFHTARKVPENTWKSVFDAVDGYHSVKLDEASSKLTTFITPWGRYRYLRFPQGHSSAGDAFNGRVQEVLSHIPRMVRIVDDMCLYDNTIEQSFWHAWDLLTTCVNSGIVVNEAKFQFCSQSVDFAGLTITTDGVKPSDKILRAIRDFPPPSDINKARSFFGLLNQVQWAYANSSKMAPFRDLVKPNSVFKWTPELKFLFEDAKNRILQQVETGVRQYDVNRETCLQTDFCKDGLGYLLLQKFCDCSLEKAPLCCTEGWKLVFAGSRFTKGAEVRYGPTEGEALAVAWALNHAHIFTQGCPKLIVSTDHKPLLGIFNNKPMEDIKNPRLVRLKEHTLHFDFRMRYNKGKWHRAPDALSRNPCPSYVEMLCFFAKLGDTHNKEQDLVTTSLAIAEIDISESVTMEKLKQCTESDSDMIKLKSAIMNGFPQTQHLTDHAIRGFFNGREHLWIEDGIVLFKQRIVVPRALRDTVLKALHAAHQGTNGMRARASTCVYWPGINSAIEQVRKNCAFCNSIAPSQPRESLQPLPMSTYPFEFICADAFTMSGHHYLVVADKYSGWPVVVHFRNPVSSKNIIDSLRQIFCTYGTPTRLYSDGGLAFSSFETSEFLRRWGVEHIISSAHYPQSNGRAELAVKTAKRILHENVAADGSLDTDEASRALLQYRNTPIQNLGLSPSQVLYHRN
ncbi:MAG: reverse transcriptase domain-containing protein, partial [Bacteroidota bacterium]